ncbi:MAG TPA: hypothetical protein VE397_05265 [Stellaceae bacterium]|jgi:hypothetical protein|nr:hypothetical protein [Stellaceae bacterium]
MPRWLVIAALAATLGACTFPTDPDRLVFGVSGARPAVATSPKNDEEMRQFLDAKVNQICTLGYAPVKVETLSAEDKQQIVDEELRCRDYHPTLF